MKKFSQVAAIALVFTSFNSVASGYTLAEALRLPYIFSSLQFPQGKAKVFRHTFQVETPQVSSALSQLIIEVPAGLTVKNNISVFGRLGQKVEINTSVIGSKIIIAFPQPVVPGSLLNIDLNAVTISGVTNAWIYPISAKLVGIDANVTLGVAQFRFY